MQESNENSATLCDESKCVSKGLSATRFNNSFTCYGDETGEFYPMMCADGYRPQIVDSVPGAFDILPPGLDSIILYDDNEICDGDKGKESFDNGCNSKGNVSLRYFTCCPPVLLEDEASELPPQRHCSDPILVSTNETGSASNNHVNGKLRRALEPQPPLFCSNGGYPYNMKINTAGQPVDSYVCCDTPIVETATNFLNDDDYAECVPYHDKLYSSKKIINSYGRIEEIACGDISTNEKDIWVPKPVSIDWNYTYDCDCIPSAYQCCKIGPSMSPFVKDAAFCKTIYPTLAVCVLAISLNLILLLALGLPLVLTLLPSREQSSLYLRQNSQQSRASRLSQNSRSSRLSGRSSLNYSQRQHSNYSSYNMYMVFLAISELGFLIYISYVYGMFADNNPETYNPYFSSVVVNHGGLNVTGPSFGYAYSTNSLYINAFIAWEVLLLLKNSHERRRVGPPSLRRVFTQALIAYGNGAFTFGTTFGLLEAASRAAQRGDFATSSTFLKIQRGCHVVHGYAIPNIAMFCICFVIWWRGYLSAATCRPKNGSSEVQNIVSRQEKAMRELAWYFLRIVMVFYIIWLPAFYTTIQCVYSDDGTGIYDGTNCVVTNLLLIIQPVLSTVMAMTKADVRAHVWDLVTLSYFRCFTPDKPDPPTNVPNAVENAVVEEPISEIEESGRSMSRASILIPEEDESSDDDDDDEVSRAFLPPPTTRG